MTSTNPPQDSGNRQRSGQASPEISKILGRLGHLRARIRAIFATIGIGRWIVAAVGLLALFFLADYFLDLPLAVRRFVRLGLLQPPTGLAAWIWLPLLVLSIVLLIALTRRHHKAAPLFAFIVGGVAGTLVWLGIRSLRPARASLSDEDLALSVEARFQGLQDRLAGALDFERELRNPSRGESTAMMQRVVHDAADAARDLRFSQAVSGRRAIRWAGMALGALALATVVSAAIPETVGLWARRSLLLREESWPRQTHMVAVALQGDGTFTKLDPALAYDVAIGRTLTVYARAEGDVPEDAHVLDLIDGQEPLARRMFRVPGQEDVFAYEFLDVRRPFTFILRGGDDDDEIPRYRVEITIPPRLLSIRSEISYPEYLGMEVGIVEDGTVSVPEGSKVRVTFSTDMDIAEAEAVIGNRSFPCTQATPGDMRSFTFAYEAERTAQGRILMKTVEGKTNDAASDSFEVRVKSDRPPRVDWIYPSAGIAVTPKGRVPLLVQATDDYGIAGLAIEVHINTEDSRRYELSPFTVDADEQEGQIPLVVTDGAYGRHRVLAYLPIEITRLRTAEGKPLGNGAEVSFRLEARDSRGQLRQSELARVDVLNGSELEHRLGSRRSNVRMSIESVYRQQEARRADIAAIQGTQLGRPERDLLKTVRFAQGKIAQVCDRAVQELLGVFNGFVYDRLGSEIPNNKILGLFDRYHRTYYGLPPSPSQEPPLQPASRKGDWLGNPVFPYALYTEVVEAWQAKTIFDKGLLDKMCAAIADAVVVGSHLAPATHRAATKATSGEAADIAALLEAQDASLARLDALLNAMRGWQSLSDMTIRLRSIIKRQEELAREFEGREAKDSNSSDNNSSGKNPSGKKSGDDTK